ncbi:hypothetical protein [Yoonia sp. I 8.24]|uniref:hypothetical protein n=1 Tax=Yoonia sp. I 8.24 TaxID=1537229 RepID=UPI001EE0563A|nr:hypothetical protein [Yoonia sp. I 8.24]MCG3266099.1 hypothetical protein [Yoonia sp. I 8.24]
MIEVTRQTRDEPRLIMANADKLQTYLLILDTVIGYRLFTYPGASVCHFQLAL